MQSAVINSGSLSLCSDSIPVCSLSISLLWFHSPASKCTEVTTKLYVCCDANVFTAASCIRSPHPVRDFSHFPAVCDISLFWPGHCGRGCSPTFARWLQPV